MTSTPSRAFEFTTSIAVSIHFKWNFLQMNRFTVLIPRNMFLIWFLGKSRYKPVGGCLRCYCHIHNENIKINLRHDASVIPWLNTFWQNLFTLKLRLRGLHNNINISMKTRSQAFKHLYSISSDWLSLNNYGFICRNWRWCGHKKFSKYRFM